MQANPKKLYGVIPPMITPFTSSGEVDVKGLEKLLDYLASHVDGLFICGSYGSGPLMSVQERKKVAEIVLERVGGKVPVVVHTGTANTRDAVELSRHAVSIGAVAVSAVAPFLLSPRNRRGGRVLSFHSQSRTGGVSSVRVPQPPIFRV
jgi:dihydrodipicolinate synthase/N-acetylneuraminate lyase